MLALLRTLLLSVSSSRDFSSWPALSPKALSWTHFRAIVCPLCGSLALYTAPAADFASSLRISKCPIFVDIAFLTSFDHRPRRQDEAVRAELLGKGKVRISRRLFRLR